ncbi:GNAT family N-acetyltransferase [Roseobacter sp. CCS2]|uniref:GNAT family N-acetyltransferase n=1 Tax=Roseobacter sp. CCS2 TaxID=391593 RepID=UPI0000F404EB|nr:GNAT family N-acetyltransferase [Roseobacter sp. CCS2]EBA13719.1 acetyltransferase, GNAT family protein [Roseobacter sp. CCS2]
MSLPTVQKLYAVIDGTWPSSAKQALGPWTIRIDSGGGNRVSAATAELPITDADIPVAEDAMREASQTPLFMIREGEDDLDHHLEARGYVIKDPTNLYAAPVADIAINRPPPVTSFEVWPPLAAQAEIWAQGGIGTGRLAVMDRAREPKTTLLGRLNDRPAGTGYVGIAADCAMIHALEISEGHRRQGLARHLTRAAAFWAQDNGADYLTLVTTQANIGANTLYSSLGMTLVGQYHYRTLPE